MVSMNCCYYSERRALILVGHNTSICSVCDYIYFLLLDDIVGWLCSYLLTCLWSVGGLKILQILHEINNSGTVDHRQRVVVLDEK